ncbi:MAG: hypothetical protein AB7E37_06985 [Candidatus Altimarinota bacterium]
MDFDKRKEGVKYGFTTILHDPKLKFDLSSDTYCIADAIYHLSNNPSSIAPGWCYSSRQSLANLFGVSKRTVQRSISELLEKELLIINTETNFMRTSQKWYDEFVKYDLSINQYFKNKK